jgi:hypothetical protein
MTFVKGQSGNPAGKWLPGQSGNPGGRPKTKPFKDALRAIIDKVGLEGAAEPLVAKANIGDVAAIKELGDRMDGKVPQAIVGDDEFDPIHLIVTGVPRDGDH